MATDIEQAYQAIMNKRPALDLLELYIEGPQPLKYSAEKLREAFDSILAHFELNFCAVVLDTVMDRVWLNGFDTTSDAAANDRLDTLFDELHLDIEADDVHNASLGKMQGYLILWKTNGIIESYYNDPRVCHVFYDSASPKIKTYAAKWFVLDDGRQEITLYYRDRLEHWQASAVKDNGMAKSYTLTGAEPNPYGVIPVFEFKSKGEINKVRSIQDTINMTLANLIVAGDYGAALQKYAISQSDPGDLKNGAGIIWWLPAGDGQGQQTSVGSFPATPLTPYLDEIDKLATYAAAITRTPKYYFIPAGANISGEALVVTESPLIKKAKRHMNRFTAVWQEVAAFLLLLDDGTVIKPSAIRVNWERPESVQPLMEAQATKTNVDSGIPLVTQKRRDGWTEAEIDDMLKDKKKEQANTRTLGQQVLNTLRTEQEQSNETPQDTTWARMQKIADDNAQQTIENPLGRG